MSEELKECLFSKLTGSGHVFNDCDRCNDYFDFPYHCCCLEICGELDICLGCINGLYKIKNL